jgi:hypothetical protein
MFGIIAIVAAAAIAKTFDDAADYREPKGKDKDRYK